MKRGRELILNTLLLVLASTTGCTTPLVIPTVDTVVPLKRLALVVPSEEPFTVVGERAKGPSPVGQMFPILGAIGATIEGSRDKKTASTLTPLSDQRAAREVLLEPFHRTVESSGRFSVIGIFDKPLESKEQANYDAILTLRIHRWGLHLLELPVNEQFWSFVELAITLVRTADNAVLWNEQEIVLGRSPHTISEYKENLSLLQTETAVALQKAGYLAAMNLLYPRERAK
jgi:hypothetical protein